MSDMKRSLDDMIKEIGDVADEASRRIHDWAARLAKELATTVRGAASLPTSAGALLEHATVALVGEFYHDHRHYGSPCDDYCGALQVNLRSEHAGLLMEPDRSSGGNERSLHHMNHNGRSLTKLPEGHYRAIVVLLPIAAPAAAGADAAGEASR